MSRIGNYPITIPDKVKVDLKDNQLIAKGPLGSLEVAIPDGIGHSLEGNSLTLSRTNNDRRLRSLHGLVRSLCDNAIQGVATGFKKVLLLEGVGYKCELIGTRLALTLGFSHPVIVIPPEGIQFEVEPKANRITIIGADKQLVGQVAATIRKLRVPEPYKGKGIRYDGEYIRRKAGKTAA